jgi:hypothetical protein
MLKRLLIGIVGFITPVSALADTSSPITSISDVQNTLINWDSWLINIFWVLTVGMLIWAAIMFVTAGGDDEKITKAKKIILYAVIAAVIALLATALGPITFNLLQGK